MLCRGLKIKITPSRGTFAVLRLGDNTIRLTDEPLVPRENWQSGPENSAGGLAWLDKIYKHNRAGLYAKLAAHKDLGTAFRSSITVRSESQC